MRIRTTVAWGGRDFNYSAGTEVTHEISDDVALARIEAGLAEPVQDEPAPPTPVSRSRRG